MEQESTEDGSICTLCNKGLTEDAPVTEKEKGLKMIVNVCKEEELDNLYR